MPVFEIKSGQTDSRRKHFEPLKNYDFLVFFAWKTFYGCSWSNARFYVWLFV